MQPYTNCIVYVPGSHRHHTPHSTGLAQGVCRQAYVVHNDEGLFVLPKVRMQTKQVHVHAFISSSHRIARTTPGWCVLINHRRCSNTAPALTHSSARCRPTSSDFQLTHIQTYYYTLQPDELPRPYLYPTPGTTFAQLRPSQLARIPHHTSSTLH
jgi:hypothetical protein